MSLREALDTIAGGLIDLHVGLYRARHHASLLSSDDNMVNENFRKLFDELDQMQHEIVHLMKEVE